MTGRKKAASHREGIGAASRRPACRRCGSTAMKGACRASRHAAGFPLPFCLGIYEHLFLPIWTKPFKIIQMSGESTATTTDSSSAIPTLARHRIGKGGGAGKTPFPEGELGRKLAQPGTATDARGSKAARGFQEADGEARRIVVPRRQHLPSSPNCSTGSSMGSRKHVTRWPTDQHRGQGQQGAAPQMGRVPQEADRATRALRNQDRSLEILPAADRILRISAADSRQISKPQIGDEGRPSIAEQERRLAGSQEAGSTAGFREQTGNRLPWA